MRGLHDDVLGADPPPDPVPKRPGDGMMAVGGPDSLAALKRDAKDAAKDYRSQADRDNR